MGHGYFFLESRSSFQDRAMGQRLRKAACSSSQLGQQLNGPALFFAVIIGIPVWGEEQQKQDAVIFSLFLSLGGGSAVFSQRNQCVIIAISRRRNHTDICGDTRKGGFVQYCFKPAEEGLNVVFQQAAFLHEMGFRFHRRGCHSKCD